jgi:hypothetical protein
MLFSQGVYGFVDEARLELRGETALDPGPGRRDGQLRCVLTEFPAGRLGAGLDLLPRRGPDLLGLAGGQLGDPGFVLLPRDLPAIHDLPGLLAQPRQPGLDRSQLSFRLLLAGRGLGQRLLDLFGQPFEKRAGRLSQYKGETAEEEDEIQSFR